ncbi:radial spoke 3, partial [Kipferlia bialata]
VRATFRRKRAQELADVRRLENEEKRLHEEREARKLQELRRLEHETDIARRVHAAQTAEMLTSTLEEEVLDRLEGIGYFYDTVEREIEEDFLPWLQGAVSKQVGRKATAHAILRALVLDCSNDIKSRF